MKEELIAKLLQVVKDSSYTEPKGFDEMQANKDWELIGKLNLEDDFRCDELDFIEVVMAMEHEFDIEIADEELPDYRKATVADLYKIVESKVD